MTRVILILIFISFSRQFFGQTNLVPNPSFEEYYSCPNIYSELFKTKFWQNGGVSPDYFNACEITTYNVGIPKNASGYQYAATGNAYAGGVTYANVNGMKNIREMIYVQLTNTLSIGQRYFVSFKVSPAYSYSNFHNIFTNNIGALFTKYKLDSMSGVAPNLSHIISPTIINDTSNWVRIKGSFVADSSYQYLVLGNLKDSSTVLVDSTLAYQNSLPPNSAYCYFDDVCVSTDSLFAYNYNFVGITENASINAYSIYPNPANEYIYIEASKSEKVSELKILDYYGKTIVLKPNFQITKIDLSALQSGIYFLQITINNKVVHNKIIVQH